MSMTHYIYYVALWLMLFAAVSGVTLSCSPASSDEDEIAKVNDEVYEEKYVSIGASKSKLRQCLLTHGSTASQMELEEIRLNLGDVYALEMSYDSAKACLTDVISSTSNDLHRAIADVDMMSVCLVTSMNKEFYDYRSDAMERFANVEEEKDNMTQRQSRLWNAACAKYHFVSLNYFRRMGMDDGAAEELDWLDDNMPVISKDTTLYSNYLLLKSMSVVNSSHTPEQLTLALRQLVHLLYMSHQNGYTYFEILASNVLARYIAAGGELKPSLAVLVTELLGDATVVSAAAEDHNDACRRSSDGYSAYAVRADDTAGIDFLLASHALALAQEYRNDYLTSVVRCTLSSVVLRMGDKQSALVHALCALDLINRHHQKHHGVKDGCHSEILLPYSDSIAELSTEMYWITDPDIVAVPEWMALVREQLSIVYASLGMRRESAYNRNIYFDILDASRQDLRAEQEEDRLEAEKSWLNILLAASVLAMLSAIAVLAFYRRRVRDRYHHEIKMLEGLVDVCRSMSAVSLDGAEDEEDVDKALRQLADEKVMALFHHLPESDWTKAQCDKMPALEAGMLHVIQVFHNWMRSQAMETVVQQQRLAQISSEACSQEYKYNVNKRDYIQRATTVSVVNSMTAFLNRALHEASKLDSGKPIGSDEAGRRMQYLTELISKINEYNDVIGHWIKVRQGMVSLNIETFQLAPLFEMMEGNRVSFDNKGITLNVEPTDLTVRGDKTLTLFMINTLLDNARKYTPSGGKVTLSAASSDSSVIVEVADTGYGLSEEDAAVINSKMVYDTAHIGEGNEHAADINSNKGYGFGLMNCKAIIEKLRKTNAAFASCRFGVRSEMGKGSVFFFSLPYKAMRLLAIMMLFAMGTVAHAAMQHGSDRLRSRAEAYFDSVYNANIDGRNAEAVAFADSVIHYLNLHHLRSVPGDVSLMHLRGGAMGEIEWCKRGYVSDYGLIISLRNEVAIASLALRDYQLYRYNNEIFTRLYTLTSTDPSLEGYCKSIQQANRSKKTILFFIAVFLLVCLSLFLLMHYRHHMLFVFNLRQLMHLIGNVFGPDSSENVLKKLRGELSDIIPVESMALMEVSPCDESQVSSSAFDGDEADRATLENMMHSALAQRMKVGSVSGTMYAFPLMVGETGDRSVVGVLGLRLGLAAAAEDEMLMLAMVVQSVAVHTYFAHYRSDDMRGRIELMDDERRRLEMEQRKVYVRNQIIDNSLSTLKHETMYYPSRLKQMLGMAHDGDGISSERMHEIRQLLEYYKDVYDILSSCAASQVERSLFRRSSVGAGEVCGMFRRSIERLCKLRLSADFCSKDSMPDCSVLCDKVFVALLADSVAEAYRSHGDGGDVHLEVSQTEWFVQFALVDAAYRYDDKELSQLFYIDGLRYDALTGSVSGAEYMVCRQIIREHDDHSPRRGCRVYVANDDGGGSRFVFTLPRAR